MRYGQERAPSIKRMAMLLYADDKVFVSLKLSSTALFSFFYECCVHRAGHGKQSKQRQGHVHAVGGRPAGAGCFPRCSGWCFKVI